MQTPIQQSRGLAFISQNQKLHVQYDSNFHVYIFLQMWLSLGEKIDNFPKCIVTHIYHLLPGKELVFLVSNSIFIISSSEICSCFHLNSFYYVGSFFFHTYRRPRHLNHATTTTSSFFAPFWRLWRLSIP